MKSLEVYSLNGTEPIGSADPGFRITVADDGTITTVPGELAETIVMNIRDRLISNGIYTDPTPEQVIEEVENWSNGYLAVRSVTPKSSVDALG